MVIQKSSSFFDGRYSTILVLKVGSYKHHGSQ